jgi:predicted LPLAT superfamily acyltransferase
MPEWQGKSKGSRLGYRIFIGLCRTLGLKPAYFVLRFVALYYFLFSADSSRHIYRYFRIRHGYGKLKSLRNIYRNYYRFGQTLLDKMVVMAGIKSHFTFHFDGEQNLNEIAERGQGGILISGHIGNWEVAGHFLNRLNTRVNIVMFDGEHRQIKQYLDKIATERTFNIIVVSQNLSHVYEIAAALQRGEFICMHADRFLEGVKTKSIKFMGEDAMFPIGPFVMAAGFNVPVSFVFAFKETSSHYHFFGSRPILRSKEESKSIFSERLIKDFVCELEQKVKMYPEQWFNYYDFWKK